MCRSIAEGGQRCAAHTRAAYTSAQAAVLRGELGAQDRLMRASIEYASTAEGQQHFETNARVAADDGDYLDAAEATSIAMWGSAMRAANDEARQMIHAADRPTQFTVDLADGTQATLHAGVLDDDARLVFQSGQCFALAATISEETGWPIIVREGHDPATGEVIVSHAWVQTPRGTYIDSVGELPDHPDTLPAPAYLASHDIAYREVLTGHIPSARHAYETAGLPAQDLSAARTFVRPVLDLYGNPAARHRTVSWRWADSA